MQARAAAIDEMIASGILDDTFGEKDIVKAELKKMQAAGRVDDELERLKKEVSEQ